MKNIKNKTVPVSQIRIVRHGTHIIILDASGKRLVASQKNIQNIGKAVKGNVEIITEGLSKAQVGRIVSDIQVGSSRTISVKKRTARIGSVSRPVVTSYSIKLKGDAEE